MSRLIRVVSAALALAVLSGCAREAPAPPRAATRDEERRVQATVTGARSLTYDGRAGMRTITRRGAGDDLTLSVAAIALLEAVKVPEGALNLEIGLVGMYRGDGEYTLPAGLGLVVPTAGPTLPPPGELTAQQRNSLVKVTFEDKARKVVQWGYLLEPCTVRIADDEASEGEVRCPKLAAQDGSTVSLEMRWS